VDDKLARALWVIVALLIHSADESGELRPAWALGDEGSVSGYCDCELSAGEAKMFPNFPRVARS
jgi:hypothetical protein